MTVTASAGYRKDYTGNGATVDWPVPFYFLDASHLRVILTNLTTLTSSDLVLGSDFTASGAGSPSGGSITTVSAYSSNYRITILRNVPLEQQTHYVEGDPFPAGSHETALDKLTMIVQQQSEVINRALVGAAGSTATFSLPLPQAGMALGWDATATFLVNVANSAVNFAAQMGDTSVASNGAGMLGQGSGLAYPATTVGGKLNPLVERYTTAGTAPTFTVSPSTPWSSYGVSSPQIRVRWSANAMAPTLNVSGLGNRAVMQRNALGVKVPALVFANQESTLQDDGTHLVIIDPVAMRSTGPLVNYRASCTGASASIAMSADLVSVRDSNGLVLELSNVSVTLNTAGTGANGLDTGTLAASTIYHKFIIYNPSTATAAALCSLSPTAPTLPSGYTHFKRLGFFKTDGTANKYPYNCIWLGSKAQLKVGSSGNLTAPVTLASGQQSTLAAVSVTSWIASTAVAIQIQVYCNSGGNAYACPNANYANSLNNIWAQAGAGGGTSYYFGSPSWMLLESANIYYLSTNSYGALNLYGWEDAI